MAKLEKYKYYAFPDYQGGYGPYAPGMHPYAPAMPPFHGGVPPAAAAFSPFNAALAQSYVANQGMPNTVVHGGMNLGEL